MRDSPLDAEEMLVVVVAVDDGPHSAAAFRKALRILDRARTSFHIVTVRRSETAYQIDEVAGVGLRDYWQDVDALRRQESQAVLDKFRSEAQEQHIKFTVVELQGDAREELCQYCSRVHADLLVLGSRGSGILHRLLLGSVSTYCAQHAPCGVLVERCPNAEMDTETSKALAS